MQSAGNGKGRQRKAAGRTCPAPTGILRKACYCRKRVQQPEGGNDTPARAPSFRQHRIIPALRLKHRSGGSPRQEPPQAAVALRSASLRLGVRHGICVAKMLDNVGLRYPHRASGQKPLALCDRCPCFGSLHPPLAALTFAAQSIICAFGLAAAAPRSPYRHLELCGIAFTFLFMLLTNQELCSILATIVDQSCNGRKGKQSENESKHEKETSNRSRRSGRCVGCGADIYQ